MRRTKVSRYINNTSQGNPLMSTKLFAQCQPAIRLVPSTPPLRDMLIELRKYTMGGLKRNNKRCSIARHSGPSTSSSDALTHSRNSDKSPCHSRAGGTLDATRFGQPQTHDGTHWARPPLENRVSHAAQRMFTAYGPPISPNSTTLACVCSTLSGHVLLHRLQSCKLVDQLLQLTFIAGSGGSACSPKSANPPPLLQHIGP